METLGIRGGIVRSLGTAMLLLSLMFGLVRDASANQSGPTVNETAEMLQSLCALGLGTQTTDVPRTPSGINSVTVKCKGGYFDGMHCLIVPGSTSPITSCIFSSSKVENSPVQEPGQITDVEINSVSDSGILSGSSTENEAAEPSGDGDDLAATATTTPEPTVTTEPESTSGAVDQTDGMPEGDITADATSTPVVEQPNTLPDLTEVQDAAPIVEVTFEAAP